MAFKRISVRFRDVYLDKNNARHEPVDTEPEAVEHLVRVERADRLALDIAGRGMSPLENIGVIPNPDRKGTFIAVEGNRRLCALKLLADPAKSPTNALRIRLEEAKKKNGGPDPNVEVIYFDTEAEADQWVALRHQGEQDGVGTRKWKAKQKTRHSNKIGKVSPNAQAVKLLEYAKEQGLVTKDNADAIAATTVTRYLSNPIVRHTLGLTGLNSLEIDVPVEQFHVVVKRFLHDALPNKDGSTPPVNSRSNADARKRYAKSLVKANVAPSVRVDPRDPASTPNRPPSKPRPSDPDSRSTVIDKDFIFKFSDKILARVYRELRAIDTQEFSFAGAYLLRAFIEQLAKVYVSKHVPGTPSTKLHLLLAACEKHLKADPALLAAHGGSSHRVENFLKPLTKMANDANSSVSPDSLGGWVHGSAIPTRAEINRRWDAIEKNMAELAKRI